MLCNVKLSTEQYGRFWSRVAFTRTCWLWTGGHSKGYGEFAIDGRPEPAHRISWILLRGPIPDGLTIDHLCRVRECINPDHLEPVTMKVNLLRGNGICAQHARQTHCKHGHPLVPGNLYDKGDGYRRCLECHRRDNREYWVRRKEREKNARS